MISNLNIETSDIDSSRGQHTCLYKIFSSEVDPTKIFVFIHGLGVHVTSYLDWLERFVNKGYVVYSFDLPGHGRSSGKRGDVGNYYKLYQLISDTISRGKSEYSSLPVVLYGHSLGGNILLSFIQNSNISSVSCCVVTAPWVRLDGNMYGAIFRFCRWLYSKRLSLIVPRNIWNFKSYNEEDPLVHHKIATRTFYEAQNAGSFFFREDSFGDMNICLVHGAQDMATSALISRELSKVHNNFTFGLFRNTRHHLQNSEEADEIFSYINKWIDGSV
ncbi:alpha/beta hydrolase [Halosquirtibacter xylanolyticus]|uniref:alpha/beta fold hydrolase n=1 Tax=Halosquirtibacter xylanolyticus TaxID=3374599 RepID=UPI00374A703E|nr:alpha/beta hydrolase [Prolixibacteraceae bacterium]